MKTVIKTILAFMFSLILTSVLVSCTTPDETVLYREADHGSWIEEFGPHDHPTKKVDGWWFMNGNLTEVDDPSKEYNVFWAQYNMRTAIYGIPMYMLMRGQAP